MSRRPLPVARELFTGSVVPLGCSRCPMLETCGGDTRAGATWSCEDLCADCDRRNCTNVCFGKPDRFVRDLLEVNGFDAGEIRPLVADSLRALPRYVPSLQHGSLTFSAGLVPWVAIPLPRLVSLSRRVQQITNRADLARELRVPEGARMLLLGPGAENPIERYWQNRRPRSDFAGLLRAAKLFDGAIAPNYSFFLRDPRPQHLFNRKRSLICASEWAGAGLAVVPYLHTITDRDWTFWERFLARHPEISMLAKEFQTGLAKRDAGLPVIDRAARLQDHLARSIHFVAIGAAQYAKDIAARFDDWTLIDSMPFMKAMHRRAAAPVGATRIRWEPARGEDPAGLFEHNVIAYAGRLDAQPRGGAVRRLTGT